MIVRRFGSLSGHSLSSSSSSSSLQSFNHLSFLLSSSLSHTPMESTAAIVGTSGGGGGLSILRSQRFNLSLTQPISFSTKFSAINNQQAPLFLRPKTKIHFKIHTTRLSAADSTQSSPSVATGGAAQKDIVPDSDFTLAKVSFGVIGLGLGVSLLGYGFGAYFNILPGSEWSAIMLTYGFPLAIIGMALKYAELKPVPCLTYSDAQLLREKCATDILKQVRNDVIRYRYGDEQHLEEALKRIFQYGQGGGIPRRSAPILQSLREEVTEDGKYCLVLVFEAKALQLSDFEKRQAKFASFFGPGISADIAIGGKDLYEVRLISETML